MMERSESELAAELKDAAWRGCSNQAKLGITHGTINGRGSTRSGYQQSTHIVCCIGDG